MGCNNNMQYIWLCWLASALFAVSGVAAETVMIDAIQDTTLYDTPAGNLSNGAGNFMIVGRNGQQGGRRALRALVRFNIRSLIPSGATINSVELQLNVVPPQRASAGNVTLHRVLSEWGEGTSEAPMGEAGGAMAAVGDATWTHTFFDTSLWQTPGGDFAQEASASLATSTRGQQIWMSTPQLVADVQSWVDDPAANFGWLLKRDNEPQIPIASVIRFNTRHSLVQNRRPQLVVDFTPSGAVGLDDPIPAPIPQGEITIDLEPVASGFTAPIWGTHASGDTTRLFVVDQTGILTSIDLVSGAPTAFLNVSDRLVPFGAFGDFDERGLLGVAFHPDYANNGRLYTYTSEPMGRADFTTLPPGTAADHQSVIVEWTVPNPADPMSPPDTPREMLRIDQPQFNHNSGALVFGPDAMLYIAIGDGGGADDLDGPDTIGYGEGNAANPGNILGNILRIDPLGTNAANGQYGIPADNPFAGAGNTGGMAGCADGMCDEIYAFGLRNPFRIGFDMVEGTLYVADIGQNDIEELNIMVAGGHYGWNLKEGSFRFEPNGAEPGFVVEQTPGEPAGLIDLIAEYDHDEGVSIIGGFVHHGSATPLNGLYIFGDYTRPPFSIGTCNGRLFYIEAPVASGTLEAQIRNNQLQTEIREFQLHARDDLGQCVLGFGQDAAGEIYLLTNRTGTLGTDPDTGEPTGNVYRLVQP